MRGIWFALLMLVLAGGVVVQERNAGAIDGSVDRKLGERIFQGTCSGCHGSKGTSITSTIPRLSAQGQNFLLFQWSLFKHGHRHDPPGHAKMKGIGDREIRSIVAYLSAERAGAPWPSKNPALLQAGEKLYQSGDYGRKIIACAVCHGKDGAGVASLTVPRVANQSPDYLVAETRVFKTPVDFGTAIGNGMQLAVAPLTSDDILAVSEYMAGMGTGENSTGK